MSSLLIFLLACADDTVLESTEEVVEEEQELAPEIEIPNYSIALVEEYEIQFVYEKLPNRVFSAGNNINLRSKPSASSAVVKKIPLAHEIELLTPVKEQKLGSRTDHWYHVRTRINGQSVEGYLFGSTMTPYRLTADWDNDGNKEHMIAAFNDKKELLLRIADPDKKENVWSNMGAYVEQEYAATQAVVKLFPKEVAGLPLLKVEVQNQEENFFWSKFVSYNKGSLYRALEYTESESDTTYSSIKPEFGRKRLSLKEIQGTVRPDGSEKQIIVGKGYVLQGGIYIEKTVSDPKEQIIPPAKAVALEDVNITQ